MSGQELAKAAADLVGVPFRLHGRDVRTGLDCIGLLAAALDGIGRRVAFPSGYRIRTATYPALAALAEEHGFVAACGAVAPGDVLFVRAGPVQLHLMIAGPAAHTFIEAHAGLRRVVARPGPVSEPILQHWRLQARPSR